MKANLRIAMGALLATALAACITPNPRQADTVSNLPNAGPEQEYKLPWPAEAGAPVTRFIRIDIGPDTAQQCGLTNTHFDVDSAEPLAQDRLELKLIAECLNRADIQALPVELIGRADMRGNGQYNLDLGQRRADRVRALLVAEGVNPARITAVSRGHADALGSAGGAYSHEYDRRVDIVLRGVVHSPR